MIRSLLVICFGLAQLHAASPTFYGATPYPLITPVSATTFKPAGFFPTRPAIANDPILLSPDGKTAYIKACEIGCLMVAIDIRTSKRVQRYLTQNVPTGAMAILPDESLLFIATCLGGVLPVVNQCSNVWVEVFNAASGVEQAVIPISIFAGRQPAGLINQLTAAPDGTAVYFDETYCTSDTGGNTNCVGFVTKIPVATLKKGASFDCDLTCTPESFAIGADGKTGYVLTRRQDGLTGLDIVDLTRMTQTGTISLPPASMGGSIAISSDGSTLGANLRVVSQGQELLFIDIATKAITQTAGGVASFPVTLSPDGDTAYIPAGAGGLQVVSAKTGTVTTELAGLPVYGLSPSRNGSVLDLILNGYAQGMQNSGGIVSFLNGTTIPRVFDAGQSVSWLATSPDDETVYAATPNGISVLSTSTGAVTSQILPGVIFSAVAVSSDGSTLYTISAPSSTFTVLNSSTGAVEAVAIIPACNGASSASIALAPDGGQAFVKLDCGPVVPINLTTFTAGVPIANTTGGSALAVSPSGAYLYAGAGNSVSVIDLATSQLVGTIPIAASSIAFSPNGKWAYLAGTSKPGTTFALPGMAVVNTSTLAVATFLTLENIGGGGESIGVSRDGLLIYVAAAPLFDNYFMAEEVIVLNALTFEPVQYLLAGPPFVVH